MEKFRERLRKVGNWISLHRHEVIGVVCVLAVLVVALPVLAQDGDPTGQSSVIGKIALWIATLFAWIAQHVVKMIVIVIDLVVVPIMRYNNFVGSPVVAQGWAVVRDLVNMFFVVILLLIAFQTIFGVGRADWKRQVPRLLIMAVVINFSRTIAGIMVDFGQVVMFTFVNAIADVAGGNFIQLFGLNALFEYSKDAIARSTASGNGFEVFDFFGAAFLTMVLTFVILATMIILAGLLAFRIVIIWCLIIVAPLTFFLGGAKGVIGGAEGYYADWWKRFTSAVSLGPILAFFVWLSLAAASSGNLAEKQGFESQANGDEVAGIGGEITKAFDAQHMTSLIIALALLFAGFEVSQQTAGSLGGRAGAMASAGVKGIPGLARSLAKVGVPVGAVAGSAALAPGMTLAAGGIALAANKQWKRVGDKGYMETGEAKSLASIGTTAWREHQVAKLGKNLRDFGGSVAKVPFVSGLGRTVQNLGFKTLQTQNIHKEHEITETTKALAGMSFEDKAILAKTPVSDWMTEGEKLKIEVAAATLPQNLKHWAKIKDEDLESSMHAMDEVGSDLPEKEKDKHGSSTLVAFPKAASFDPKEKTDEEKYQAIVRQLGTVADKNESIRKIQVQNFTGKNAEWFIRAAKEVEDKNGRSIWSKLQDGVADPMVKKWFKDNKVGLARETNTEVSKAAQAFNASAERARSGPALDTSALNTAVNELAGVIKKLTADDIRQGAITPALMNNADFAQTFGTHAKPEVIAALDPATRGKFLEGLDRREMLANFTLDADERAKQKIAVEKARARAGVVGDYDRTIGDGKFIGADDTANNARKVVIQDMINDEPAVLEQLSTALGNFKGELAEAIAEGVRKANNGEAIMNKLIEKANKARPAPDASPDVVNEFNREQAATRKAIDNLNKVLINTNKQKAAGAGPGNVNDDALARLSYKREKFGV